MHHLTRKEEQVLLAVYHLKDNAYLITIREMVKKYTGKSYSVGTIYAPLNRLHINGYLRSDVVKPEGIQGGKPIKYYRVTKMGVEALTDLKRQNDTMWEGFVSPAMEKER